MDAMDDFFDDEHMELESMRNERGKMEEKDFAKLLNKRDLSSYEMDELFM